MPSVAKQSPRTTSRPSANGKAQASPWDAVDTLRVLIYGQSGTGKTTLASTFPGPTLWLICSGGDKPGELRSIDTPENRRKITPVVVNTSDDFDAAVQSAGDYATVVLDHASGFADMKLGEIIGKRVPAQKGWGLASQQQYGQQGLQLKEAFRTLLSLPGNIIFLSQERTFGGRDDGMDPDLIKPTVGPALTPSVAGWLSPACDYVVQTFKKPKTEEKVTTVAGREVRRSERVPGVDYCIRTGPHDLYITKFRIPKHLPLPEIVPDPDYDKIQAVIKGEYQE